MTIRLKKDIVIPAGTVLSRGPVKTEYPTPIVEHIIGFGPNHSGDLRVDIEAVLNNPDTFEAVSIPERIRETYSPRD